MINKNDVITVQVVSISFEGFGVAKYRDADLTDFIIFINGAIPGDTILCKVVKVLKKNCFAKIEQIITPSKNRILSDCPSFGRCGGCSFRHVPYEVELNYKQEFFETAFRRQNPANTCKIGSVIPSPQINHYRNKAQLPFSQDGYLSLIHI